MKIFGRLSAIQCPHQPVKVHKKLSLIESKCQAVKLFSYKACKYHPFAVIKNLLCSACLQDETLLLHSIL